MIEKDPGCPKINRLRVIHLYECDLNLMLGISFRKLQRHCEDNNMLNDACYGGRPNRRAIDPVLIDVTQTEIAKVTRRPLVRLQNDLQQFFDRILQYIAQLKNQPFGFLAKLAKLLGDFLFEAVYRIKTRMGVSKKG